MVSGVYQGITEEKCTKLLKQNRRRLDITVRNAKLCEFEGFIMIKQSIIKPNNEKKSLMKLFL